VLASLESGCAVLQVLVVLAANQYPIDVISLEQLVVVRVRNYIGINQSIKKCNM
jgi:hypothetical protein